MMKRLIVMLICYAAILIIVGCAVHVVFSVDVLLLLKAGSVLWVEFITVGTGISICKFIVEEKSTEGKRDEHAP